MPDQWDKIKDSLQRLIDDTDINPYIRSHLREAIVEGNKFKDKLKEIRTLRKEIPPFFAEHGNYEYRVGVDDYETFQLKTWLTSLEKILE